MGHLSTKQELVAILRRFDMDGDAKINMAEFSLGMKSSLTVLQSKAKDPSPQLSAAMQQNFQTQTPLSEVTSQSDSRRYPQGSQGLQGEKAYLFIRNVVVKSEISVQKPGKLDGNHHSRASLVQ